MTTLDAQREFVISRSSAFRIVSSIQAGGALNFVISPGGASRVMKMNITRSPMFPDVDASLKTAVDSMHQSKLPITMYSMQVRGVIIRKSLLSRNAPYSSNHTRLSYFLCSTNYIKSFVILSGLRSVRLHGSAGSVDLFATAS